ncbi:MAG TPA: hypothetical protein VJ302_36595 [Blastocatellia bacterium]|nr:hypothetical protein [Blastocatellia bacterium]
MATQTIHKLTPQRSDALRERGLRIVRWQGTKAAIKLTAGLAGTMGPTILGAYLFVTFMFPGAVVIAWIATSIALIYEAVSLWEPAWKETGELLRRRQEIRVIRAIAPLVERYRAGQSIDRQDRFALHQLRELILAQITRYRVEADDWRTRGRIRKGAAITALLLDLEDAQKLLSEGFARSERELRPVEPARLEIEAPPLERKQSAKTGMEGY